MPISPVVLREESIPSAWRHFQADIILLCVRWYLRSSLSSRDLEEIMLERGLHVDHTTIYRWGLRYAPELEQRCRPSLKATTDSWRVEKNGCTCIGRLIQLEASSPFASCTDFCNIALAFA